MLKIGEFSKLSRVSVRMMRHYDEVGLLAPSEVDSMTGYRYYSERQLITAGRIAALRALGFGLSTDDQSRERAQRALNEFLRPEFLNRIDEIIAFNQLTEDNFRLIAEIMLNELNGTLADKEIRLTWDDSLLALLVEKSYSVKYGARNLRRLIEKEIENPLANAIVTGDKPLLGAHLSAEDGRVKLDTI